MHASVMHLPGLLPRATFVQESTPVVDHRPAFLLPPPELRFTNDAAFLALDDAFINVIFVYMVERFYSEIGYCKIENNININATKYI
jgi:hypothetical protein